MISKDDMDAFSEVNVDLGSGRELHMPKVRIIASGSFFEQVGKLAGAATAILAPSTHCAQCGARSMQDCADGGQCEHINGAEPEIERSANGKNTKLGDTYYFGCEPSRRDRIRAKIMSRVEIVDTGYRDPITGEPSPCHLWTGPTSGDGKGGDYARMSLDGATVAVHKASWVNENGLIPPRKQLDHLCSQRRCVREEHLELTTHKQNQKRRDQRRKAQ